MMTDLTQGQTAVLAPSPDAPYLSTRGALLRDYGTPGHPSAWRVEELRYDHPREGEVVVKIGAAGLCHSDYHYNVGDATVGFLPLLGGHEGAGVITAIGPNTGGVQVGDHVITTFMPACGRCRWCVVGRQNLCDLGVGLQRGTSLDGTHRLHTRDGTPVSQMTYLGTFCPYTVCPVDSVVEIDPGIPFAAAAVVGCAVPTGWGSAVHIAGVEIGDTVVIVGVGGVGMNAVQGARRAGASNIVVVDPVEWKRQAAVETFGATHQAASMDEAWTLVRDLTRGVMADRTIMHMDIMDPALLQPALDLTGKGGVLALSNVSSIRQTDAKLDIRALVLMEKQIRGGIYGSCNPRADIPRLIELYRRGDLLLDELVTRTYRLEQINEACQDMVQGRNLRGVIVFDE